MEVREKTHEAYFAEFRRQIIGRQQVFVSPFGEKEMLYADWTASGRAYGPIETRIQKEVLPFVGNTHTETTITGTLMSRAYETAREIVKRHVNAGGDEVLIFCGSGMTGAVNKLQRILGWRVPEQRMDAEEDAGLSDAAQVPGSQRCGWRGDGRMPADETSRPVVFVTHMEHHSNQISWMETIATVEIIRAGEDGNVDLGHFRELLERYKHRKTRVAAVTACSNVTGIRTPYREIARIIHGYGGLCFVDFACSAPYVGIDMHPAGRGGYAEEAGDGPEEARQHLEEAGAHLDAIYFSPHKFLGGPGTPGVLVFHKKLYGNRVPDQPGGGTVVYSNPWKEHEYVENIEQREDGGTPPFLGAIKAAMCIRLKERMGVENMLRREEELLRIIFDRFAGMDNVQVLEGGIKDRLGVVSFIITGAHYNMVVKLLNDRYGIQTRGGCSCAGTYGHWLLGVDRPRSYEILQAIRSGDLRCKPGWVRVSVHPTMTDAEIRFVMDAIEAVAANFGEWGKEYMYDPATNEYVFKGATASGRRRVEEWFSLFDCDVSPVIPVPGSPDRNTLYNSGNRWRSAPA